MGEILKLRFNKIFHSKKHKKASDRQPAQDLHNSARSFESGRQTRIYLNTENIINIALSIGRLNRVCLLFD